MVEFTLAPQALRLSTPDHMPLPLFVSCSKLQYKPPPTDAKPNVCAAASVLTAKTARNNMNFTFIDLPLENRVLTSLVGLEYCCGGVVCERSFGTQAHLLTRALVQCSDLQYQFLALTQSLAATSLQTVNTDSRGVKGS
jgi:hypothetical protein